MATHKQLRNILMTTLFSLWTIFFQIGHIQAQETQDQESTQYVSIDFDEVDIRVFIKFISELTNENFVIDNQVKGNVNILSPGKITVAEAYKVFESVLEVHGFTAVKAGEITKIIPIPEARSKNVETRLLNITGETQDKIVTQLIPLEYADSEMIKQLFAPLLSKGAVILGYAPTNTLIITDMYSNIKRLQKIIQVIDVKDVGRQISVIPLDHADAANVVKMLSALFQARSTAAGKKPGADQQSHLVADERTNTIILLANEFDTLTTKELISVLDREVPRSDAKIQVYYLENAKAEDMATVLQSLSEGVAKTEAGKQAAPIVSDKVKITHDKGTNSLIIMADKDDYQVLENIIKKLDISRPMVYIEALIMEVRDTENFTLGVEWMTSTSTGTIDGRQTGAYGGFTRESGSGISALPSVENNVLSVPGGFALGVMGEAINIGGITFPNLGAAIRAVKKNEQIRIISTPQILTLDNEEAEISVGENVPYLTTSGSGEQNYNSYEYKDVGVVLKITPQISQGRFVRLNIYQKVEKLTTKESTTPTTLKRTAETTVVVKDQATVVIGGLIGEDLNSADYQVPCLGDVPVAGHLFKSRTREGVQTNLYIFLTPRIIENPEEADVVYKEKKQGIEETTIYLYKDPDPDNYLNKDGDPDTTTRQKK